MLLAAAWFTVLLLPAYVSYFVVIYYKQKNWEPTDDYVLLDGD
jgi:hypothetical protein